MSTKIVITGMGIISPVGNTVASFWTNLCNGVSGIGRIEHFDSSELPTQIAGRAEDVVPEGFGNKELRRADRYTIFALEACDQAWNHAGLDIDTETPERCGAIVGTGIGGISTLEESHARFLSSGVRRLSPISIPKLLGNMAVGEVGIRLGLRGPNRSTVTACATGAQAIAEAAQLIQLGRADVMLAGGSEASLTPYAMAGFCAMRAMSRRNDDPQRASRPFDADRDGFVMGEGAGVIALESEEHAKARGAEILAELAGTGETCDAYHVTAPRPDGSGAAGAMRLALDEAGVNPDAIGYFNAHGTSTKHNDAAETLALKSVFGDEMPLVSSTKSMIGHLLGAAGAVEGIVCIQAIREGVIPPNINYETPDPECDVNLVANESREARIEMAMSNSLGFGGHNASIILKRYE